MINNRILGSSLFMVRRVSTWWLATIIPERLLVAKKIIFIIIKRGTWRAYLKIIL